MIRLNNKEIDYYSHKYFKNTIIELFHTRVQLIYNYIILSFIVILNKFI